MRALGDHYNFKIFTRHELERDFFDNVDMVCIPGGFGDASKFDYLLAENGDRIKQFVKEGGAYLGICMGAYWAGKHYLNILNGVDAVQYINRPKSDTRRPHAKNIDITWNDNPMNMYFYDGCALVGKGNYKTVARYANGDSMAIIQNRIGLIGCHPESEQHWYDAYRWMKPHWHQCSHYPLLLNFVDSIINT
jgi:glutamine amidotransferase-like uncharacterized protein